MAEEQRHLPDFKEFMEQMYGVKVEELTPEEKDHIHNLLEKARALQIGQSDT